MEKRTNVITGVALVAMLLSFIGYFFSLFTGNAGNTSTYTILILIFVCVSGILFSKEKLQNKIFDILRMLDGGLLVIFAITVVAGLFM